MRRYENDCVNCDLPCVGDTCRYYRVAIDSCDICGEDGAEYHLDGDDMHEECAKKILQKQFTYLTQEEKEQALEVTADKLLQEVFDDLSITEQAEVLDISLYKIDD